MATFTGSVAAQDISEFIFWANDVNIVYKSKVSTDIRTLSTKKKCSQVAFRQKLGLVNKHAE